MKKGRLLVILALLILPSGVSADCIIMQSEHMGIPVLPDFKSTVTTYCSDANIIKVDYEQDNNFFVGLFASQLQNIPDQLYSLPEGKQWSLYEEEETFDLKQMYRRPNFTDKTMAQFDSIRKQEGIDFVWEVGAIGRAKDTIADIPCDRIFFSGVGISQGDNKAKCVITIDIRTAEVCAENDPINRTYVRFVDSVGFDPLQHYVMGLALGVAFNAPVETVEDILKTMYGFPIQIDLSMAISDWNSFNGTFTYNLDLREIVETPVPQDVLTVPDNFRPKTQGKPIAKKR